MIQQKLLRGEGSESQSSMVIDKIQFTVHSFPPLNSYQ